jgi:hypothetical protein
MAEQSNDQAPTPDANTQSTGGGYTDNQPGGGAGRAGEDERRGEGGYGNDTGFATGSVAPRDDDDESADAGGLSAREQQTSDTYRDPKRADTQR